MLLLVACTETHSPPPSPSAPATESSPAVPLAPLACTTVEGTRNVWLVSRADPSVSASPSEPRDAQDRAAALAGPDAQGRLYLLDGDYELLRSDDDGCTWQYVWTFLGPLQLWTSPATERLYAWAPSGDLEGQLWASDDGGESFEAVNQEVPGPIVFAQGPHEARADGRTSMFASTDGGETWQVFQGYPSAAYGLRVDPRDSQRIAYTATHDPSLLWQYDGTSWTSQSPDPHGQLLVASWTEDELVLLSQREDQASVFLRSPTGTAPFTEIPWGQLQHDFVQAAAADGPRLVAAGLHDPPGGDWTDHEGFVVVADDTALHRYEMPGFDEVLGIAVTETSVVVGFQSTLEYEWW
jgi:hypothetical protein